MRAGCWHATRVAGDEVACLMLTRRSTTLDLIQHLSTDASITESAIAAIPAHRRPAWNAWTEPRPARRRP